MRICGRPAGLRRVAAECASDGESRSIGIVGYEDNVRGILRASTAAVAVLVVGLTTPARATTHTVTLSGITFDPADLTINVGDTVHWVWVSGFHNVESGVVENAVGVHDGRFRSGDPTVVVGTTFDLVMDQTFLDAHPAANNVYPYFCVVHADVGMEGTITVQERGCTQDSDCDDGDACNGSETCQGGDCVAGAELNCDDGNPCTDDSCDAATGCRAVAADGNSCDDGNVCNGFEVCRGGVCRVGAAPDCDDANPCTSDSCNPVTGCRNIANDDNSCDDDDECTTDACVNAVCVGSPIEGCVSCTTAENCDDDNPCTLDRCTAGVCEYVASNAPCDDGDACTDGDSCGGDVCVGSAIPGCCETDEDCNDNDPCSRDACSRGVCVRTQIDGCIPCTSDEDCHDGNVCTDNSCDAGVCVTVVNGSLCDDENPCTDEDICTDDVCEGSPIADCCRGDLDCDDGDPCTTDTCDGNACTHPPIEGCGGTDDGPMPTPTGERPRLCGAMGAFGLSWVLLGLGIIRIPARRSERSVRGVRSLGGHPS